MKLPAIPPLPAGIMTIVAVVLSALGVTDTNQVTAIKTTIAVIGGLAVLLYNYEFHKTKRNQATAAASIHRPIVIAPAPSDPVPGTLASGVQPGAVEAFPLPGGPSGTVPPPLLPPAEMSV